MALASGPAALSSAAYAADWFAFLLPFTVAPWNEAAGTTGSLCFFGPLFAVRPRRLFARRFLRPLCGQVFRSYGTVNCCGPCVVRALRVPSGFPFSLTHGRPFARLTFRLAVLHRNHCACSAGFLRPRKFIARRVSLKAGFDVERRQV